MISQPFSLNNNKNLKYATILLHIRKKINTVSHTGPIIHLKLLLYNILLHIHILCSYFIPIVHEMFDCYSKYKI